MLKVLHQGQGFTLARSDTPETLVPYFPCVREDGAKNHGWIDLRGHPELASQIPEVATLPGLAEILRVVAASDSPFMTGACERAMFQPPDAAPNEAYKAGAFVTVMYQDAELNAQPREVLRIATEILSLTGLTDERYAIDFEMILEPLKLFFGRTDCYCICAKSLGYGPDELRAWEAVDYACAVMARGLERLIAKSTGAPSASDRA